MKLLPFTICLLVISASALRAENPSAVIPPWKLPSHAWFLHQIPPPPAPDSKEGRQDLKEVLALQAKATPKEIAQAKWDYNFSVFTFSEVLGRKFTAQDYPKTKELFLGLNNLVREEND